MKKTIIWSMENYSFKEFSELNIDFNTIEITERFIIFISGKERYFYWLTDEIRNIIDTNHNRDILALKLNEAVFSNKSVRLVTKTRVYEKYDDEYDDMDEEMQYEYENMHGLNNEDN